MLLIEELVYFTFPVLFLPLSLWIFFLRGSLVSWEKGKYSRNASQELSVPWAETPQGRWSQNPVSALTGTLSGKSLGISLPIPARHAPVWGVRMKMELGEELLAPLPQPDGKSASVEEGQKETFSRGTPLFYQSSISKGTSSHLQLDLYRKYQRGWAEH